MALPVEEIVIEARGLRFPALSCGSGPLVLCLHGFPDTRFTFRELLPALAAAGHRAVAPALRGYDLRCMPPLHECHAVEVARDADAIVAALHEETAHLVGHDWGAVAAYLAGTLAPARWRSIVTLAIPHPWGLLSSLPRKPRWALPLWYMAFFQLRGIADRVAAARDHAFLEMLWRRWSPRHEPSALDMRELRLAFAQPGVTEAALAYYRAMFDVGGRAWQDALPLLRSKITAPLLAIHGAEDGCMNAATYDVAMKREWFSELRVERVPAIGHFLHLEAPARIGESILAWIREHG